MSTIFNLDSPIMRALSRMADLLILNLLTLLCCIPVVTAGAALTAMIGFYLYDVMDGSVRGHFANIRIYTDDGIELPLGNYISAPLFTTYTTKTKLEIPVKVEKITSPKMNVILDISFEGRPTSALVKATLYAGNYTSVCAKRPGI